MTLDPVIRPRARLLAACAVSVLTGIAGAARAAEVALPADATSVSEIVVTSERTTRSSVSLPEQQIQKVLPGISPLKAIEKLPGVLYVTADPWGNNEQNLSLFVHGFSTQQLAYTMDGTPLGDQQYGNYNGLSVSRAISSENVSRVTLSSGAGSLGVASTSNLGGAIETFSRDPSAERGLDLRQTVGSYSATRTFLRGDTGETGLGRGYLSYLHQDQRAWDFNGHQRDDQVNFKWVKDGDRGRFTLFLDWQTKVEPNEDATAFGNQQTAGAQAFTPYTRPFLYPNLAACSNTLTGGPGTPPPAQGNNFSNCFSAAQRTDLLGYVKYDYKISSDITWSNQAYYHYDYGRGIVAGPINQAGLPTLFALYFPQLVVGGSATSAGTLANISSVFGGSGNEVRTTEYRINRGGLLSTLNWQMGDHAVEGGLWYERNEPAQHRVWYPFTAANNDLSPYDEPRSPAAFIQYYYQFYVNELQLHLQDQWRVRPNLLLQAGVKTSLQQADGKLLIAQRGAAPFPSGQIDTANWFLPQIGAVWDATDQTQLFANVQKNLRQFIPYGAGSNFYGFSPWSLVNQAAFNLFKSTVDPETSWTFEAGVRTHADLGQGVTLQGQASAYHVKFENRLLNIAPYNFINPAPGILANVGSVTSDGFDLAATLGLGRNFHLYDALSYNRSRYDSDYASGTAVVGGVTVPVTVASGGKRVPLVPELMNRTIASVNVGGFEAQLSGDYVGKRYVTYLNDLSVKSYFQVGLEASYGFDQSYGFVKSPRISLNVTNLGNIKGVSTAVVTGASGGYQAFPIAPRMVFVTLQAGF